MSAAAELALALKARPTGRGWVARCPAHDDRTPSLSIRETDDGRLLLKCFAGCSWASAALLRRGHRVRVARLPDGQDLNDILIDDAGALAA